MHAAARAALAILAILPAAAIGAYFLAGDLVLLADPCHEWAAGSGGSGSVSVAPGAPCQRRSGSSQTLASYLFTMLWVKGSIALGCSLGAVGIFRRRRAMALAGALVLAAIGVPLMLGGSGILMWASAVLVGLASLAGGSAAKRDEATT